MACDAAERCEWNSASAVEVAITDWVFASGTDTMDSLECHEAKTCSSSSERNLRCHCRTRSRVCSELIAIDISVSNADASDKILTFS